MSDFWQTEKQMERLWPTFPMGHGRLGIGDLWVLNGIVSQLQCAALARCVQRLPSLQDAVQVVAVLRKRDVFPAPQEVGAVLLGGNAVLFARDPMPVEKPSQRSYHNRRANLGE